MVKEHSLSLMGEKYIGKWKDDKNHGQGTYTFHNGNKYEGEWKDGERWNGAKYGKSGNIQ